MYPLQRSVGLQFLLHSLLLSSLLAVLAGGAKATDYYIRPIASEADIFSGFAEKTLAQTARQGLTVLPEGFDFPTAPVLMPSAENIEKKSYFNSFADLSTGIKSGQVQGGDRIFLLPGYHGPLVVKDAKFQSPVKILSLASDPGIVASIDIRSSTNIAVDGIDVWSPPNSVGSAPLVRTYADVSFVTFSNLDIRSTARAVDFPIWKIDDWKKYKHGGFLLDGDHISALGNTLTGVNHGVLSLGKNARIEGNLVNGFSGDGIRALGDHSSVKANVVQNCFQIDANHADGFQSFSRGASGKTGTGTVTDLSIENNMIYEWNLPTVNPLRCKLQGIGLYDGMFDDVKIANNVVSVSAFHGINVEGATDLIILQNTVVNARGLAGKAPWIRVTNHKDGTISHNIIVANNSVSSLKVQQDASLSVIVANNTVVDAPIREYASIARQDYTLLPNALSANSGSSIYTTPFDITGRLRPLGTAPDAGAFESQ